MSLRNFIKNLISYPSLPDFYILGAQKAGTTSLDSYLKYHPQLKGTHPKELHFFDNKKVNEKGLNWYMSHFKGYYLMPKKLLFESTPNYLFNKKAPKELQKINSKLKLIVLLRNPIERAYSAWNMFRSNTIQMQKEGSEIPHYYQVYLKENGEFMSFEEVVNEEFRRIEEGVENPEYDETFTLIRKGLYHQQLNYWKQFFPENQFFVRNMEDLTENPLKYLNQLSEFLGISSFSGLPIDFKPRNKRDYQMEISADLREKLKTYYK